MSQFKEAANIEEYIDEKMGSLLTKLQKENEDLKRQANEIRAKLEANEKYTLKVEFQPFFIYSVAICSYLFLCMAKELQIWFKM